MNEAYTVKKVVREIECDISYLEDAPDEMLAPFVEKFGLIGKRLMKLKECLKGDQL